MCEFNEDCINYREEALKIRHDTRSIIHDIHHKFDTLIAMFRDRNHGLRSEGIDPQYWVEAPLDQLNPNPDASTSLYVSDAELSLEMVTAHPIDGVMSEVHELSDSEGIGGWESEIQHSQSLSINEDPTHGKAYNILVVGACESEDKAYKVCIEMSKPNLEEDLKAYNILVVGACESEDKAYKVFEEMSQPKYVHIAESQNAEAGPDERRNGVRKLSELEEENENQLTSEQEDRGLCYLENEEDDDFLHLKAENPLVEMVGQSSPSKPEVIEDAHHMLDEMPRSIPVSLTSDAFLFEDEDNDYVSSKIKGQQSNENSLINKAESQFEELSQSNSINIAATIGAADIPVLDYYSMVYAHGNMETNKGFSSMLDTKQLQALGTVIERDKVIERMFKPACAHEAVFITPKAMNPLLDEVGQLHSLNLVGLRDTQQPFDAMPSPISIKVCDENDSHGDLFAQTIGLLNNLSSGEAVPEFRSVNLKGLQKIGLLKMMFGEMGVFMFDPGISSRHHRGCACIKSNGVKHDFDKMPTDSNVEAWVGKVLMLVFDPGGSLLFYNGCDPFNYHICCHYYKMKGDKHDFDCWIGLTLEENESHTLCFIASTAVILSELLIENLYGVFSARRWSVNTNAAREFGRLKLIPLSVLLSRVHHRFQILYTASALFFQLKQLEFSNIDALYSRDNTLITNSSLATPVDWVVPWASSSSFNFHMCWGSSFFSKELQRHCMHYWSELDGNIENVSAWSTTVCKFWGPNMFTTWHSEDLVHSKHGKVLTFQRFLSKETIFVMATILKKLMWEPGLWVVYIYILEDKDVKKRKGIGIRLTTIQNEWLNGVAAQYIAHKEIFIIFGRFLELTFKDGHVFQMKQHGEGFDDVCLVLKMEQHQGLITQFATEFDEYFFSIDVENFVWDPGFFLGCLSHHLEDKVVVEGKDMS